MSGAWGAGLATLSEDRVLEVWYPAPALGEPGDEGEAARRRLPEGGEDEQLGVRRAPVLTLIADLAQPPADAARRLPAPAPALAPAGQAARLEPGRHLRRAAECRLDDPRAGRPGRAGPSVRLASARAASRYRSIGVDKFPRMTDYVVPSGVRIADADRVRLGAHLAEGTTVMHEGFVNYNAGHARALDGRGPHLAPASSSATAPTSAAARRSWARSPAAARSHHDRRALPARRQRRPRHLAGRRLHRRGGPLRHRRHDDHAARRRGRQGARALGASGLLFRRNSLTGAVEALPRAGGWAGLNAALHANSDDLRRPLAPRAAARAPAAGSPRPPRRSTTPASGSRPATAVPRPATPRPSPACSQRKNEASPPALRRPAASSAPSRGRSRLAQVAVAHRRDVPVLVPPGGPPRPAG